MNIATILIADDDAGQRRYLQALLGASGFETQAVGGGEAALAAVLSPPARPPALLLLDIAMPDLDGISVLKRLRAAGAGLPVLVITSDGSIARAVEAMQAGATDFLVKPVGPERLEVSIRNALSLSTLSDEVQRLSRRQDNRLGFDDLIAVSPAMREAIGLARRAARSDIPLLIEGESGTGKEVFARAVHGESTRAGGPFVAVNCGALPAQLVESILFGHEKGAFTGALTRRRGRFQEASGGTLFLDEVGDLPPEAQVKLLRALQNGEVDPVGAEAPERVDVRLISATNRDLGALIAKDAFREDLYYRIAAFPLGLAPLRQRREDIAPLAHAFLKRLAALEAIPVEGFTAEALALIEAAPWPGNVRQLENALHRAVVLSDGARIGVRDIRVGPAPGRGEASLPATQEPPAPDPSSAFFGPDGQIRRLADIEAETIRRALALYRGRISEAARRLGIGRSTLYRKIDELRLSTEVERDEDE
ncbi:MAG: sigma-54 dependent transcriptional regulator [Pseudomonadota bacterium]